MVGRCVQELLALVNPWIVPTMARAVGRPKIPAPPYSPPRFRPVCTFRARKFNVLKPLPLLLQVGDGRRSTHDGIHYRRI